MQGLDLVGKVMAVSVLSVGKVMAVSVLFCQFFSSFLSSSRQSLSPRIPASNSYLFTPLKKVVEIQFSFRLSMVKIPCMAFLK